MTRIIEIGCLKSMESIDETGTGAVFCHTTGKRAALCLSGANREGVKRMLLTEYDEAKTMELFKEEGRAGGRAEGRAEGREQGFTLGIARLAQLMAKLFSQGRSADAERAANDEDYRNQLFEEYGI